MGYLRKLFRTTAGCPTSTGMSQKGIVWVSDRGGLRWGWRMMRIGSIGFTIEIGGLQGELWGTLGNFFWGTSENLGVFPKVPQNFPKFPKTIIKFYH